MIYGVQDCSFITEEYALQNYIHFADSLEKAAKFVKDKYDLDVGLNEPMVYSDDEDGEYGERFVLIEVIEVK